MAAVPTLAALSAAANAAGLALRGAFEPLAGEVEDPLTGAPVGTVVLLGFTGGVQWPHFAASMEAADGAPHPLDRWSRRVIGALAARFGARAFYPNDQPAVPFQRYALRCEPLHPSPLGLLIHPRYGLWHAYRGGLYLGARIAPPPPVPERSPCETCVGRPCLSACPVGAFGAAGYAVGTCVTRLSDAAGRDCVTLGCQARLACPVGAAYRYGEAQARFHMGAFLAAMRPT